MINRHRIPLAVAAVIMLAVACTESIDRRIILADSLSIALPDSAMKIMDRIDPAKEGFTKQQAMRYELIRAKVQNRAFVDFTTDSVMREVADYYDRHGTANDRVLAHYLLGCTYRDLKESPMSLQCYYDAVEAADTLSRDCDYSTLMSIWGQIAYLLNIQCLPIESLEALENYQKYALMNGDTLNYIKGFAQKLMAYNLMGDTVMILECTDKAQKMYLAHNYTQQAAKLLPSAINVWLNRHDYEKARKLQQIFETQAGVCDAYGNIKHDYEYYYYGKGLYCEGTGDLDSAIYFYRKLFNAGHAFDASQGFLRVYSKIGNADSVFYYSKLKDSAFDARLTARYAETVRQVKGMYDYTRNQKIVRQKEKEVFYGKVFFAIFVLVVLVLATVSYLVHRNFRKKKIAEMSVLNETYLSTALLYKKTLNEQELLKHDYKLHQETKDQEIRTLNRQLADLQAQYEKMTSENRKAALNTSNIVKCFRHFSPLDNEHPNDDDWEELELILSQCVPSFYCMIKHNGLNINEQHVCMLISIGFSSKDASNLMHTQQQHIANIKSAANSKLFNDKSARTLEENLTKVMKTD